MRIVRWLSDNILFVFTLFLLAFIPLYPKFPLIDIKNTWVYIRLEDFFVLLAVVLLGMQVLRRKATLKTPLTIPIILFWVIGGISTLSAIYFIFPYIADVFPNVAILSYVRRIEYLAVFFVAFASMRDKRFFPYIVAVTIATLIGVVIYGYGQKSYTFYELQLFGNTVTLGWPQTFYAYSTMNEEFAKGIPLRLSEFARVTSTFAGHYDLAAYLVMVIPITASLIFGFRKWYAKIFFFLTALSGLILLLMTASRVSFAVYLATITFMLILQKKKLLIIPVIIASIFLLNSFQGISQRYSSTIKQVDLVVDARTGKAVGIATTQSVKDANDNQKKKPAIVIEEKQSTGEDLPQGSGYINLPVKPSTRTITDIQYKRMRVQAGTESAQITNIEGDFVIKKVLAYDVSFTTRFQGEWPRAIDAFKRSLFLGSGYSSISLATDNNYLRILGEIGILGLLSYLSIFLVAGIYLAKVLSHVDSKPVKSFVLGITAGVFGLGLNAILIDVFEASKVAFVLWLFMGIGLGLLHLYQKQAIDYKKELFAVITSLPAIAIYILLATFLLFSFTFDNYFIGDDFTWLRWAADCKKVAYVDGITDCQPIKTTIQEYFTKADGFFYRPGTKLYFFAMYAIFWLNPVPYYLVLIGGHVVATVLVLLLATKVLRSKIFGTIAALFFLVVSVHSEALFWISTTGHLVASCMMFASLLFYIYWQENKKNIIFFIGSIAAMIIAPLFHEMGIVTPFFIVAYDIAMHGKSILNHYRQYWYYLLYILLISFYLFARSYAKSHGLSGDYNYNFAKLPYNFVGNMMGYIGISLIGSKVMPLFDILRQSARTQRVLSLLAIIAVVGVIALFYKFIIKKLQSDDKQVILFSMLFFVIALLPFVGLGNMSLRYAYVASFAVVLLLAYLLQKLGVFLAKRNYYLAVVVIGILITLFTTFHISELYRIDKQWTEAGQITNTLLINFNDVYGANIKQNPVFYFVNVPIKHNEAWIFPVGISDALWFTFQNEYLTVHAAPTLDIALDAAEGSASARVFEFDKKGNVEEVIRTKSTILVPIEDDKQ